MNSNRAPQPYGLAYQAKCAKFALASGCKGNAMGLLYCLFQQSGLWDWTTGQTTRPISHTDLGDAMGGLNYDTVRRAIAVLRKAGVLGYADHRGRGVKWSDGTGHANKYKLLLPPVTASDSASDPGEKTTTPPVKKRPDPRGKNDHHYHKPIYSNGSDDTPSRREGDKSRDDPALEETRLFSQWHREHGMSEAMRMIREWREAQTVAAE